MADDDKAVPSDYVVCDTHGMDKVFFNVTMSFGGNGLYLIRDGNYVAHYPSYSYWYKKATITGDNENG